MKKIISLIITSGIIINLFMLRVSAQNVNEQIVSVNNPLQVTVNAKACILMDANTGKVLTGKNEHEKLFPASVTKIMSLLLVCEAIDEGRLTLDMEITCSESAAEKGGSQIWLEPGEVFTVNDLLKATVVYSANDACCLLGETISGSEEAFCELMNKRAKELGMENTLFVNCTGLDDDTDDHKTTAYDIALMSKELLSHDIIRNYTNIWMDTLRNGTTQLVNTNKLIRSYSGATGLKTGTTSKAGCCVSATAERDGLELIAVVLGADNSKDRFNGAKALLDWGFSNYEIVSLDADGLYNEICKVSHGVLREITVTHAEKTDVLLNKGLKDKISHTVTLLEEIEAPVTKGQKLGSVVFSVDSQIIGEIDLISSVNVDRMTMSSALWALFSVWKQ